MGFAVMSACPLQVATCLPSVLRVKTQQGAEAAGTLGLQWVAVSLREHMAFKQCVHRAGSAPGSPRVPGTMTLPPEASSGETLP